MEQHAVPQDITGFKFKLVGDMTLKQFGELAGGAVIAYIFYATTWPAFIKWPFVFLFGFLGFALAFLPIEERPLDVWILNFFKAVYHPTLFSWKKNTTTMEFTSAATTPPQPTPQPDVQLWPYPKEETTPTKPPSIEDLQKQRDEKLYGPTPEEKFKKMVKILEPVIPVPDNRPKPTTVEDLARLRDVKKLADEAQLKDLKKQFEETNRQINDLQIKMQALAGSDTTAIQNQIQELEKKKGELDFDIEKMQPNIIVRAPVLQKTISLTDVPNIINGNVTNQQNAPLDSTVVIIKDEAGNAIRALKTNQIGQFIASTPLENGTYYLEFERQGNNFDVLKIVLDGKVIPPFEIHAH